MPKVTIVLITMFSVLILLAGCAQATPTGSVPPTTDSSGYPAAVSANPTYPPGYPAPADLSPTAPAAESGYPAPAASGNGLQVVASDGTTKTVTMADLNDLPKATVGSESGPKLIDVLQFAGIFDFSTVTVTGSNGSKDLTKDQVNDQVILGLANGSVTLAINGTPQAEWIMGVITIKVK